MPWHVKTFERVITDVYSWMLPLVTINILWFLLSLTIVLMPPATAALYEIARAAEQGRGPYVQDFLAAVRRWLVRSWLWGAATLFLALASALALAFYNSLQTELGTILYVVSGVFIGFVWLAQFYFWPYMLLQEQPRALFAVRNAAFTVLGDPLFVLIHAGIAVLLLVVSVILVAPLVVITPIAVAFLGVYSLRDWLSQRGLMGQGDP